VRPEPNKSFKKKRSQRERKQMGLFASPPRKHKTRQTKQKAEERVRIQRGDWDLAKGGAW
jgi:hypothetical protein